MPLTRGSPAWPAVATTLLVALLLPVVLAAGGLAVERQRSSSAGAGRRVLAIIEPPLTLTPTPMPQVPPEPAETIYLVQSPEQAAIVMGQVDDANWFRAQVGSPPLRDTVIVVTAAVEAELIAAAALTDIPVVDLR